MELKAGFQKLGLSQQESEAYLAILKIGQAKVSEIAQKADIKREAAYYTIKSLLEKGYISEVIKSGVKYYSAISPKRLLEMIEEEKLRKYEIIKDFLPELESLQNTAMERPKIELFEGNEGLKTAASIMTSHKNIEIYSYFEASLLRFIPYFHPQFRRRRRENNVKLKVITSKSDFSITEIKNKDKEELRETRFLDEIIKDLDSSYYILPEGILILKANEKEQLGIYIKEPSTARLQKNIFQILWKIAKK